MAISFHITDILHIEAHDRHGASNPVCLIITDSSGDMAEIYLHFDTKDRAKAVVAIFDTIYEGTKNPFEWRE